MISYNKLCEKYNRILYTTILFTLYSAPPLPPPHDLLMCGFILCHLIFRKRLIAHALCLAHPDFKIRLGHLPFAHTGKVFFIRPLVDLPDIVVVNFLFEAFCRSYFTAGLSALHFAAHTVLGLHLRCVYLGMLLPSRTSSLSTRKTPQCSTPAN